MVETQNAPFNRLYESLKLWYHNSKILKIHEILDTLFHLILDVGGLMLFWFMLIRNFGRIKFKKDGRAGLSDFHAVKTNSVNVIVSMF